MQCLKVLLLATAASLALTMADAQTNSTSEPLASRLAKRPLFPDTLNYVSALLPSDADTQPLWDLVQSLDTGATVKDQIAAFENLISSYPNSPWTPSLRANLASFYRQRAQFSLALAHWEAAWLVVRDQNTPGAKAVGDYVLGNWTELLAALGQADRLSQILVETRGRILDGGPWQVRYNSSVEALARMLGSPQTTYRCGIRALQAVGDLLTTGASFDAHLRGESATDHGLSFADLQALAQKYGLQMVPVELPAGADPVVPSIVHFKLGHFAAILKQDGSRYWVDDPVFRTPRWFNAEVIKEESSGRYLIPAASLSSTFRILTPDEQSQTIGRGYPTSINDADDTFQPFSAQLGLTSWKISEPYLNLWLQAPIIRYPLPGGQFGAFDLTFKQRNSRSTANAFNFGSSWECSWLTYVDYTAEWDENPPTGGQYTYLLTFQDMYMPSAGVNLYTVDGSGNGTTYYNFTRFKQGRLKTTEPLNDEPQLATTSFTVTLVNGTILTYGQDQYFSAGNHRAYLQQITDPQGRFALFNYVQNSGVMCLTNVVDFNGTACTLLYNGTPGRVTGISDPFGHTNYFGYNASGYLVGITNPASFGSIFTYDSQGTVTNINTPYGNTAFIYTVNTNIGNLANRSMEVVVPWGGKHLYLYRDQSTYLNSTSSVPLLPSAYPSNSVPSTASLTNTFDNTWMDARNSFYWNPRTFVQLSQAFQSSGSFDALTTNDYKLARLSHWLQANGALTGTLSMQRGPSPGVQDGQKTWYDYFGKSPTIETNGTTDWYSVGSNALPRFVAYVLPDGTSRFTYKEYNALGNPTTEIGTWGVSPGDVFTRTNSLVYDANNVYLVAAYNTAGELILSNVYNSIHQVVTNYNASSEKIVNFYQTSSPFLPLGTVAPNGLASTNYYFTSGSSLNYLKSGAVPALGVTNSYTYTNGLVFTHTTERGLTLTNTYDVLQRPVALSRPDGTARLVYTNLSLIEIVDRLGNPSYIGYDAYGRKICDSDALNRTNWYGYSTGGDLIGMTNALSQSSLTIYDNLGEVLALLNGNAHGITNQYNLLGQLISAIDPMGASVTNYYANQGNLVASSNAFGLAKLVKNDVRDRTTNVVDSTGASVNSTYDLLGRVLTQKSSDGGTIGNCYSLNVVGPTHTTNQIGKVTSLGYDLANRITAVTNANNEIVRQSYGVTGELLSLTDPKGQVTSWGYDVYGRQTSKTNANQVRVIADQYDPLNRRTNHWTAAHTNIVYAYDAVGNLLSITFPRSPSITFKYDALNRITNRIDAAGVYNYTFNAVGKLVLEGGLWAADTLTYSYVNDSLLQSLSLAQPNASPWVQSYGYDGANRVHSITSPAGVFGYQYNSGLDGYGTSSPLIQQISFPNGAAVTNYFDPVGRIQGTELMNSQGTMLDNHVYTYDPLGEITNVVRYDSSSVAYQYDNIGQLVGAHATDPGSVTRQHEQFGYGYDAAHNMNSKTNNALVESFSVDALNQLSGLGWSGTLTVAGTTTGPATNVTVNGASATRYADNSFAKPGMGLSIGQNTFTALANDSLARMSSNAVTVTIASSDGYAYDLDGNMLSDGQRGYDYDDTDQLIRITSTNSWKSEFTYDGLGQRRLRTEYAWQNGGWVVTSVAENVYANGLVVQERDGSNLPRVSYTRGPDKGGGIGGLMARTDNTAQTHAFYHADGNGNVTTLLNGSQSVVARYLYDPYGNTLAAAGSLAQANVYGYSSKELHSPSGLIYFGLRFYSPNLQRWLNRDVIAEAGGINMFAYVGNSPTVTIDPWGADGKQQPDDIGGNGLSFSWFWRGGGIPNQSNEAADINQQQMLQDQINQYMQQLERLNQQLISDFQAYLDNLRSQANNQEAVAAQNAANPGYVAPDNGVNAPDSITLTLATVSDPASQSTSFIGPPPPDPFQEQDTTIGSGLQPGDPTLHVLSEMNATLFNSALTLPGLAAAETPQIMQNAQNGLAFESAVLDALGIAKNTTSVTASGLGTTVPDIIDASGNITDIKNVIDLTFTRQLQIQAEAARGSFNLIVSPRTQSISQPLLDAVNTSGGRIQIFDPVTGTLRLWH
jgi:RHS repeat-associated protein